MTATATAAKVTLIQIGRRELRLDDATYRAMLANLCGGKTSSTVLTDAECEAVLTHMKARGFVVKPKAGQAAPMRQDPMLTKLRAMWWTLADAGHVSRPADVAACTQAVEAWALKQMGPGAPAALRFMTSAQLVRVIEQLQQWLKRVNLPVMRG